MSLPMGCRAHAPGPARKRRLCCACARGCGVLKARTAVNTGHQGGGRAGVGCLATSASLGFLCTFERCLVLQSSHPCFSVFTSPYRLLLLLSTSLPSATLNLLVWGLEKEELQASAGGEVEGSPNHWGSPSSTSVSAEPYVVRISMLHLAALLILAFHFLSFHKYFNGPRCCRHGDGWKESSGRL